MLVELAIQALFGKLLGPIQSLAIFWLLVRTMARSSFGRSRQDSRERVDGRKSTNILCTLLQVRSIPLTDEVNADLFS